MKLFAAGSRPADSPHVDADAHSTGHLNSPARAELIATSAYYMAQERGFTAGHEVSDWLAAEAKINTAGHTS